MTTRDTDWIDIGLGHLVSFRYAILRHIPIEGEPWDEETLAGLRDSHPGCGLEHGWIPFANASEPFAAGEHGWIVENWDLEHFTLSSSLLCRVCGDHGYVRDGKWVPA